MIVTELFTHINDAFRGNDDDAPASGSSDYNYWLRVTIRKVSEWAGDSKQTWLSQFEIREVGTVTTDLNYDLDSQLIVPSDGLIITKTDGQDVEYKIVKPQERDRFPRSVYISGSDPQVLTFSETIAADSQIIGGTIKLPGYYVADDLTTGNATVPVDDPFWLVYAVAAELSFNDLTYESKYPDLLGKANSLYSNMTRKNRRGSSGNPRTVRVSVNRIRGL